MGDPRRIDVHHHVTPPSYIAAAAQITYGNAPRMSWSLERSLDDMDKGGVATSIDVAGPMILAALRRHVPGHLRGIDIRAGRFGTRAGLVGAAFAGARGADWRRQNG